MTITKAKVKYSAGTPREGQYGPSINILVVFGDGKEARIYGKPGDPIQNVKSGDVIDVVDDNGKLKYVQPAQTKAAAIVTTENALDSMAEPVEKPDLAAIAFEISSIYTQAYIDIYNKIIEAEVPLENASAATSTIFIQVFQKLR